MSIIFKIIKKNFRVLLRSKRTAFMLVFGPLLVILLIGMAFNNTENYQIRIGAHSQKYSNLSQSVLDALESEGYGLTDYATARECRESVKRQTSNVCLLFSPNLTINPDMNNSVDIYVDYSQFNIAYMVLRTVSSELGSTSQEVTQDLTSRLLAKIKNTRETLSEKQALLSKLTTHNTELEEGVSTVHGDLGAMELDFDTGSLSLDNVSDSADEINEGLQDIGTKTTSVADEANSSLTSIQSTINATLAEVDNSSSVDTERLQNARDIAADTRNDIADLRQRVNARKGTIKDNSESIKNTVDSIKQNLDELETRLGKARDLKNSSREELETLNATIAANLETILELKSTFGDLSSTLSQVQVEEAADIANPIKTSINPLNADKSHFNYLYPTLLVLLVMFVSILLSATLVVMEKNSKAFVRNIITPTRDIYFIIATYLTSLSLILLQTLVVFGVSYIFIPEQFSAALLHTSVVVLLVATMFILLGMAIGYALSKQDAAIMASFSVGCVFMLFSGVILPLESMPTAIMKVALLNPFVIAHSLIRKALFFSYGFGPMMEGLLVLIVYSVVLFVIIVLTHTFIKRRHAIQSFAARHIWRGK